MALVETEALSRRFGSLRALDELTLAIEEGEWMILFRRSADPISE